MKTDLCELLGIELPIIQAPMGGAVGPALAAAVSNAGGLGMLAPWRANIDMVRQQIRETRTLTPRPFGVNLNLEFPQEERLVICLDERVPVISFFWRDPSSLVPRAKAGGQSCCMLHTVGSVADAKRAVDRGVDIVVAQGWEFGRPCSGNRGDDAARTCRGGRGFACSCDRCRWRRGWARPCCGFGARRQWRLDWNSLPCKPRGHYPPPISRAAFPCERERHGFSGKFVRHPLAKCTSPRSKKQNR